MKPLAPALHGSASRRGRASRREGLGSAVQAWAGLLVRRLWYPGDRGRGHQMKGACAANTGEELELEGQASPQPAWGKKRLV